jgi:hypothetical protein
LLIFVTGKASGALYGWTGDCIFIQYLAHFKLYLKFGVQASRARVFAPYFDRSNIGFRAATPRPAVITTFEY